MCMLKSAHTRCFGGGENRQTHIGRFVPSWLLRFYATLTTTGVVHLRAELMNELGATICVLPLMCIACIACIASMCVACQ